VADVAVHAEDSDRERMFGTTRLLLKGGRPVVRDGRVLAPETWGATHVVRPGFDAAIERRVGRFFADYRDMRLGSFRVTDGEIEDGGRGRVVTHACRA
jgi:formylmethanofuran dehydrogenase subunit A